MIFQQMVNEETGCLSYLIGCGQIGRAVVVDASEVEYCFEAVIDNAWPSP